MRATLAAAALLVSGCAFFGGEGGRGGGPSRLAVSSVLPSAEGEASFRVTDDGNTAVSVRVRHLARPERLTPPARVYVVWARPPGKPARNLGALTVDEALNGTLETVAPDPSFELAVTAEPAGDAQAPSGAPLLWTTYHR